MIEVNTKVQAGRHGDKVIAVLTEEPEFSVGDQVELKVFGRSMFDPMHVTKIVPKALMDITHDDLVGFVLSTPQVLWSRIEAATGTGQPGEKVVYFVTMGSWADVDWGREDPELNDDVVVEKTPKKPKLFWGEDNDEDE